MNGSNLYEYAVVRHVPSIERGEFINIGLLMMCKRRRWLRMAVRIDPARLEAFRSPFTSDELKAQLRGMEDVAAGGDGPLTGLPVEERFRWLTAVRSASLQTSRPHPGMTDDLDATFARLFETLVV